MSESNSEPLIPDLAEDDRDTGWGEQVPEFERALSERDRQILADKPPHW